MPKACVSLLVLIFLIAGCAAPQPGPDQMAEARRMADLRRVDDSKTYHGLGIGKPLNPAGLEYVDTFQGRKRYRVPGYKGPFDQLLAYVGPDGRVRRIEWVSRFNERKAQREFFSKIFKVLHEQYPTVKTSDNPWQIETYEVKCLPYDDYVRRLAGELKNRGALAGIKLGKRFEDRYMVSQNLASLTLTKVSADQYMVILFYKSRP